MLKSAIILGIETSCDETAAALVRAEKAGRGFIFSVLQNLVYSQIPIHRQHGGVVPEVAAREHAVRLPQLLDNLARTREQKNSLMKKIDAVAVTAGPGLITSLLVGVEYARTISAAWQKPLVGVNHLEGHIYANLLTPASRRDETKTAPQFSFPVLCLIVSGGHTELVLMKKHLNYKLLGSTRDDAVGEAFDKTAKLLGLPYPGGPELSRLAKYGRRNAINFPRAMMDQQNFDFSFAGLKTAVAVYLKTHRSPIADVAASFEAAAVDALIAKTIMAAKKFNPKTIVLAGGVAANLPLRRQLRQSIAEKFPSIKVLEPNLAFTTDNAAMIAAAGAVRYLTGRYNKNPRVDPRPPLK